MKAVVSPNELAVALWGSPAPFVKSPNNLALPAAHVAGRVTNVGNKRPACGSKNSGKVCCVIAVFGFPNRASITVDSELLEMIQAREIPSRAARGGRTFCPRKSKGRAVCERIWAVPGGWPNGQTIDLRQPLRSEFLILSRQAQISQDQLEQVLTQHLSNINF